MKSLYTILIAILISSVAFGQTYLSEDFSGGTFPPPGWFNLPVGDQWTSSNTGNAGGIAPELKFTGFTYTGTVRFISPVVDLSGVDTVMLMFKHLYANASAPGPKCGVATRAGGTWNSVWEESPTSNLGPEEVTVLISNDDTGNDNFQFCFYLEGNLTGINNWYLDDIILFTQPDFDAKMSAVLTPAQIMNPEPVEGRVTNLGTTPITELSVSWESYAGVVRDSLFSGLNIGSMETFEFMFDGTWASPYGTHELDMWINSVNGGPDEDQSNDSIQKPIEYISYTFQNRPAMEEFTSSTCGPCAGFNSSFVPWSQSHEDDITLIKYQMSWPGSGDPYYTAEGGTRRSYYGVTFVPDMFVNGAQCNTNVSSVQAAYDAAILKNVGLKIASSFTMSGSVINITTNIRPFQSYGSMKIHNVVFEKMTTQNVGTNGETEFHHVMMKMMPDATGATENLQEGVPVTLTYTYDMANTHVEELDDLMVGVLIQDPSSKEIIQSDYGYDGVTYSDDARLAEIYLDGEPLEGFDPDVYSYDVVLPQGTIEEPVITVETMDDGALPIVSMAFAIPGTATIEVIAEDLISTSTYDINYSYSSIGIEEEPQPTVNVFPNPADDHIYISGLQNARVAIHTVDGKLMILKDGFSGNSIDISHLPGGIYFMNIIMDNKQIVRKKIAVL
ncbi:MAG: T9SS type A sorting domain-containing protein [Bacteroidota bacterium]